MSLPARPPARRWSLTAAVVACLLTVHVLSATAVSAHDALIASSPADGAQVATSPVAVILTFNGPVGTEFSQVTVTGPDGASWEAGAPLVDGAVVTAPLTGQGPAGTYQVAWRVVSADGHPIADVFAYVVTTGPTTSAAPSTASAPAAASTMPAATATPREQTVVASQAATSTDGGTNWLPIVAVLLALMAALAVTTVFVRRRGEAGGG